MVMSTFLGSRCHPTLPAAAARRPATKSSPPHLASALPERHNDGFFVTKDAIEAHTAPEEAT